jgi:hypothetical protein
MVRQYVHIIKTIDSLITLWIKNKIKTTWKNVGPVSVVLEYVWTPLTVWSERDGGILICLLMNVEIIICKVK